jgi:MHS family alpha-ketoglutarate permease-like MFS transporter
MVVAARAGNAVEWYDFAVYRAFAAVPAAAFFAGQDRVAGLSGGFAGYAIALFWRGYKE